MKYDEALKILKEHHQLEVPRGTSEYFSRFATQIIEWNQFAGLLSRDDVVKLDEHIADSLSLVPYLSSPCMDPIRCLDIGSGAGFPAIPIAVVRRDIRFELWESNKKKASFLRKVVTALGLTHCSVTHARFDSKSAVSGIDYILSRATAPLDKLIPMITQYLDDGAKLLYQGKQKTDPMVFTQEGILDEFDRRNLRRSCLSVICSREPDHLGST